MAENEDNGVDNNGAGEEKIHKIGSLSGMYESWFLEYASYVIMERAVPKLEDGLKPVQRRIMHSMKEMDDGRFNKVANIIGHAMSYHPHGDAAIGDAIVNLGQKDLLIETQGNWGDIHTGDRAAAPRYIEARLSKFAKEVVFNPQTTEWQLSYDGRKKEPVFLPVKFPLLLAQGVEGIAVGLATKIMPHNFNELVDNSINYLKGKKVNVLPDFPTGGMADFSNYNNGQKGGRIRVRARIEELDKKTLIIRDIPYSTTTNSLIDSVIKANDSGKIKIKKITDNTAKNVEIEVILAPGTSPDVTIDALYAFTDCEISISPNCCLILDDKPQFLSVNEVLKISTDNTVNLLKRELEIRKGELMEKIMFSSLEKIFIQDEMYIAFKNYDNKPDLFAYLDGCFEKYKPQFYREITNEDYEKLTQIPMIRITRFDTTKADEKLLELEKELKEVLHWLDNLTEYAIDYFNQLKDKFGKDRQRQTEIRNFETIEASVVAAANAKLYVNYKEGFIGTALKKDEFVADCSDIDDIIVLRKDGKMIVTKIADKVFVGKDIVYAGVWNKNDERMVYNMVYLDGKTGNSMIKRYQVLSITRDKEYPIGTDHKHTKVLYFTANPNGEAEIIGVYLSSGCKAKKKVFDFDFADVAIKGRGAKGNILTKYPVRKIELKEKGVSTLSGLDLWFDDSIGRLNRDERGTYIGEFNNDDRILAIYEDGQYEVTDYELTNKYDPKKLLHIEKLKPEAPISVLYYDGPGKSYYVKRFVIETNSLGKKFFFINEHRSSKIHAVNTHEPALVEVKYKSDKETKTEEIDIAELIDVKGWKAIGNKFQADKVLSAKPIIPEIKKEQKTDDSINTGDTIDLTPKKEDKKDEDNDDQLGLF